MQKASDPTVNSLITNGRRRLVYVYEDGKEMVEEYDIKTHDIITRKIKKPTPFKEGKWEYEIGDGLEKKEEELLIVKSSNTVPLESLSQSLCVRTLLRPSNGECAISRTPLTTTSSKWTPRSKKWSSVLSTRNTTSGSTCLT